MNDIWAVEVADVESLNTFPEILGFFKADLATLKQLVENVPKAIENMLHEAIPKDLDGKTALEIDELFKKFDGAYDLVTGGKQKRVEMPTPSGKAANVLTEMLKFRMLERSILNMSLVYLISKFENFLELLLRLTFLKKPATLMTEGKSLTYDELLRFSNYKDLVEFMSEKEISSY